MKKWLSAFRLRTLPLALSSIILGSFLAHAHNNFILNIAIFSGITTILLQILSNLANDYGDSEKGVDNADRVGPQRTIQSGDITPRAMKTAIIIFTILALISGVYLIYIGTRGLSSSYLLGFFGLGVIAILAAIKYTMGKNPYGYIGLGDLFVYLFFGLTGVMGTYFLHAHTLKWELLLPASAVGLLSTAVLNLNNMRDRENDAKSGKKTLVVKLGIKKAMVYHSILLIGALLLSLVYCLIDYQSPLPFLFLLVLPVVLSNLRVVWTHKDPASLDPELKKIALGTLLYAVAFGFGLIL